MRLVRDKETDRFKGKGVNMTLFLFLLRYGCMYDSFLCSFVSSTQ